MGTLHCWRLNVVVLSNLGCIASDEGFQMWLSSY